MTGHQLRKLGTISGAPELVWKRICPDHPTVNNDTTDAILYFLQWLAIQLKLLKHSYTHVDQALRAQQLKIIANTPKR